MFLSSPDEQEDVYRCCRRADQAEEEEECHFAILSDIHSHVDISLWFTNTAVSIPCIIAIPSNVCTIASAEGFRRHVLPNVGGGAWEQRSGTVVEYINATTETHNP